MHKNLWRNRTLTSIVIMLAISLRPLAGEQPPINWKTKGTHQTPALHGSLMLQENMHALFEKNLFQNTKNKDIINPDTEVIVVMTKDDFIELVQITAMEEPSLDLGIIEQSEIDNFISGFKDSIQEQFNGDPKTAHYTKWICEPTYNHQTNTLFFSVERIIDGKQYIQSTGVKLGKKIANCFVWQTQENKYALFKDNFETLVNNFTFDSEFASKTIVLQRKFFVIVGIIIFIVILSLLTMSLMYWKRRALQGNKKILIELLICVFFAMPQTLSSMIASTQRQLFVHWISYLTSTALMLFFIFFFWTWQREQANFQPARSIIKVLCAVMGITLCLTMIQSLINILHTETIGKTFFTLVFTLCLGSFIIWKYRKLMATSDELSQDQV